MGSASAGFIVHFDGLSWEPDITVSPPDLYDVWGSSPVDVVAVGGSGTILRYHGTGWAATTSDASAAISAVWGSGPNDVYAVGSLATIEHWNGMGWERMAPPVADINYTTVWGSAPNDVWVGGYEALFRFDGTSWSDQTLHPVAQIRAISGSGPDDIWVGHSSGWVSRALTKAVSLTGSELLGSGRTRGPTFAEAGSMGTTRAGSDDRRRGVLGG